jgi:hypothetical protein
MDDQLFVDSYQHIPDRGRYDKVEKFENPAAREGKVFHKK